MDTNSLKYPTKITDQRWPCDTRPVVSICCITYNHKDFIAEAIDSFLMQETNFRVEIIIHDDASNDGTADIVKDYQKRHPQIIKTICQLDNQYSKGVSSLITTLFEATGMYAALCEGDDYWICNHKLQKQVEYMRNKGNVSICFHDAYAEVYDDNRDLIERKPLEYQTLPREKLVFDDFAKGFAPHTASCLVLNRHEVFEWLIKRKLRFAKTVFYALLENGEIAGFLPERMSVYRIHPGGVFSCIPFKKQLEMSNTGLWANRKYFSSKHHKMLFSVKLMENYIALLRIQILDKKFGEAIISVVKMINLLFVPVCIPVIRIFTGRFTAFLKNRAIGVD